MFFGILFGIYMLFKLDLAHVARETAESILRGNSLLQVGALLIGLACSVLGGYVAGRIAKHDQLIHGALSSYLCVSLGVVSIALGKGPHPWWQQALLMASSPLFGLLGGYLSRTEPEVVSVQG
jgi:putative membrane protein (TIGR04086 family)